MKKILCLVWLFWTLNSFAQINVPALLSGQTQDVVCFGYSVPGDPTTLAGIECGAFKGGVQNEKLG